MGSQLGIAVFGAGRIGAVHVRNIVRHTPGAKLVGIADVDAAAAQALVTELHHGRVDDAQAFLDDPNVAAIVIATPTKTHEEFIARACAAGKHMLCEKPISHTLRGTRAAGEAARKAGVILQVGFQRRFDPEFSRAKGLVEEGSLGSLRFLRLVGRDRSIPPFDYLRTSAGQFIDQMVHEFDAARWLMGPAEVEEVFATGSALAEPRLKSIGDVDVAISVLRFSGGALAVLDASREAPYGYDARAELVGSRGMYLAGHERLRGREVYDETHLSNDVSSFIERFARAYRNEIGDFVDVIRTGREPRVGASDAFEALRLALASERSRAEGRAVRPSEVDDAAA